MSSQFKIVRGLKRTLERALDDFEGRRLGSICPIPQDFYRPTAELVKHCKKRVEKAENFRRNHEKKASVRFIVQIALFFQYDQIGKHEAQLEDCRRAVKLATETIKVMSRAHERRIKARRTGHGAEVRQHDLLNQDDLLDALQVTGGRDYLRRMKKAGCNLKALRRFSISQLHPNNRSSTASLPSNSSCEPSRSRGDIRYASLRDPPLRISNVHVVPQMYEREPSAYNVSTRYPNQSSETMERGAYYQNELHSPARTRNSHQSPGRVAPRGRGSTSSHRGSDHSTVPAHIMLRDEYQSHPSREARHDLRSSFTEVRHPVQIGVRSGQHSSHRGSDDNHMNHLSEARECVSTRRRNSAYHNSTAGVDEPTTYSRPEVSHDIQPEFSSGNHSGRNRMARTMRSRSISPQDGYHARRGDLRAMPLSHGHEDYQQAVQSRESSRRRRSSSISQDDERQSGRSWSISTSTSRLLSVSRTHQARSGRGRTSSYDSAVDVAPNPRYHTRVNRLLSREPNVEMVPPSPTLTSRMPSGRTSSASSYDSAIYISRTGHHIPDRRNTNGTSSTAPRAPRRDDVLQSYPPSSFHFDENRPNTNRKSLKKKRRRSSRSR